MEHKFSEKDGLDFADYRGQSHDDKATLWHLKMVIGLNHTWLSNHLQIEAVNHVSDGLARLLYNPLRYEGTYLIGALGNGIHVCAPPLDLGELLPHPPGKRRIRGPPSENVSRLFHENNVFKPYF